MDRVIPQSEQRSAKRGKVLRWSAVAIVALALGYFGLMALRPSANASAFRMATVERGAVQSTISASGLVVPAFEEQLNAPVSTEIEEVLLRSGAEVAVGDLIMELDREYVALQVDGRQDQLTLKQNSVDLLNLEYDKNLRDLKIDAEMSGLELKDARAQLADAERLLKVGGNTAEDVESARLAVRMAELAESKLANDLAYQKASLAGRRRDLTLQVDIEEKEVKQLARKLRETTVKAPRTGVITWVNESIGQRVPEGEPLVRIADLAAFRVEGSVSDRYTGQLETGMPVELRMPNGRARGTVSSILPEVTNNTLKFLVALDDPQTAGLRPNMRVDLVVVTGETGDVLRLANGPAIRGGTQQSLFVVRGEEAVRSPVGIGERGGDFVEVTSGLANGDRVIISSTEDYDSRESIQLTGR